MCEITTERERSHDSFVQVCVLSVAGTRRVRRGVVRDESGKGALSPRQIMAGSGSHVRGLGFYLGEPMKGLKQGRGTIRFVL